MLLNDYLKELNRTGILGEKNWNSNVLSEFLEQEVKALTFDSREVVPGALFICKGVHFDASYLQMAMEKGAIAAVCEEALYETLFAVSTNTCEKLHLNGRFLLVPVSDIRSAMIVLADLFYDDPQKSIHSIGITGTKGKSTSVYYIRAILDCWLASIGKEPSGILSSIDTDDGIEHFESHLTTPENIDIRRHFHNAVMSGRTFYEMEVSSQALKYGRTDGLCFDVAGFMNIGTDHISPIEHPDFQDYYASKLHIFEQCRNAVINGDDEHIDETIAYALSRLSLRKDNPLVIVFSKNHYRVPEAFSEPFEKAGGTLQYLDASDLNQTEKGIRFNVKWQNEMHSIELTMPGLFNEDNALCAIAACLMFDVPFKAIQDGLYTARVPGRMEPFYGEEGTLVLVDYAHNKMSFEALYSSTRTTYPDSHIVGIYGCPGKKALARRHELAEAAANYANEIIITEEDYGEEPLSKISGEIADAARNVGLAYRIIDDREEAIRTSILEAKERAKKTGRKTIILLTGKGRETRLKRGTEYVPVPTDVEFVEKYL